MSTSNIITRKVTTHSYAFRRTQGLNLSKLFLGDFHSSFSEPKWRTVMRVSKSGTAHAHVRGGFCTCGRSLDANLIRWFRWFRWFRRNSQRSTGYKITALSKLNCKCSATERHTEIARCTI